MSDTEYDRVPYKSNPYSATHPDQLAVLAHVMGLSAPAVDTCRYLELGCGAGGNLLPLAAMLPNARFVGVDLAPSSIAYAQEVARDLGLTNIEFHAMSITDVDDRFGKFDFIASHGVFSWVPEPVREGILRAIRDRLVPNGVAYVSYNTKPGWGIRTLLRDMMLYHVRDWSEPAERTSQARAILDFVAKSSGDGEWGKLVRSENDRMKELSDWYIYHDNLAPTNRAFWFHEFAEMLQQHDLEYLGDSMFGTMLLENFSEDVQEVLRQLNGEVIRTEQYLDYIRCRYFRQSLVVHASAQLDRRIDANRLVGLRFTTRAMPQGTVDLSKGVVVSFKTGEGLEIVSEHPLVKAALVELYEARPESLHFDELFLRARKRLDDDFTADEETVDFARRTLASNLLTCFGTSVVVPHVWRAPTANRVPIRPHVFAYARYQAAHGVPTLTNLRHEGAKVDTFERIAAMACDGTRDREAILDFMMSAVDKDELKVRAADGPFKSIEELRAQLAPALDAAMIALMRFALLHDA